MILYKSFTKTMDVVDITVLHPFIQKDVRFYLRCDQVSTQLHSVLSHLSQCPMDHELWMECLIVKSLIDDTAFFGWELLLDIVDLKSRFPNFYYKFDVTHLDYRVYWCGLTPICPSTSGPVHVRQSYCFFMHRDTCD